MIRWRHHHHHFSVVDTFRTQPPQCSSLLLLLFYYCMVDGWCWCWYWAWFIPNSEQQQSNRKVPRPRPSLDDESHNNERQYSKYSIAKHRMKIPKPTQANMYCDCDAFDSIWRDVVCLVVRCVWVFVCCWYYYWNINAMSYIRFHV